MVSPRDVAATLLAPGVRDRTGEPTFSEPWQARAFALMLAAQERDLFTLNDFQAALTARVSAHEKKDCISSNVDYYTRWIEALQDLLAGVVAYPARRVLALEHEVITDASSRKVHQHVHARDAQGHLRIAPIVVDGGRTDTRRTARRAVVPYS